MENDPRLEVAEGFALLGMRSEAVQALDQIPLSPWERELSECILSFMTIAAIAQIVAEELARQVTPGSDLVQRSSAGHFWLHRAITLCIENEPLQAQRALLEMVRVWPEGMSCAMEAEELAGIWP